MTVTVTLELRFSPDAVTAGPAKLMGPGPARHPGRSTGNVRNRTVLMDEDDESALADLRTLGGRSSTDEAYRRFRAGRGQAGRSSLPCWPRPRFQGRAYVTSDVLGTSSSTRESLLRSNRSMPERFRRRPPGSNRSRTRSPSPRSVLPIARSPVPLCQQPNPVAGFPPIIRVGPPASGGHSRPAGHVCAAAGHRHRPSEVCRRRRWTLTERTNGVESSVPQLATVLLRKHFGLCVRQKPRRLRVVKLVYLWRISPRCAGSSARHHLRSNSGNPTVLQGLLLEPQSRRRPDSAYR